MATSKKSSNLLDTKLASLESKMESKMASLESKMASLENKLTTKMSELEGVVRSLDTKLQSQASDIQQHEDKLETLEKLIVEKVRTIEVLDKKVQSTLKTVDQYKFKITDLENRSRRQNLRIIGFPERVESGDLTEFFSKLLWEIFGDEGLQTKPVIDRAHRVARFSSTTDKPRAVIVRLHYPREKELLIRLARKKGMISYQVRSYNQLAFVNGLQGNYIEAIHNLGEAEKILRENYKVDFERRSIITYGNFAWVHYHMGHLTEAQSYLDKLEMICKPLSDGPPYSAMIPEVYGEKGWSLLRSAAEYYEEAKECFRKGLEEDPDNEQWSMGYATVLFQLEAISGTKENRERRRSVLHLRRVLEFDPDNSVAMVLLALKLQEFKQKVEANKLVEQALQKTTDFPKVLRYAAKFYRKEQAVEKAIELLKKALGISPHASILHDQLGTCYKTKLLELLSNPLCDDPQTPEFQQKTELLSQCKYHFAKASEHRPRSSIKSQLDLADTCAKMDEYSKAKKIYSDLQKLENIHPENMQKICLYAGKFELHCRKSESDAIRPFLKGLEIENDTKERKLCHMNLERWADRQLCKEPTNSKALGIKGLLYQLNGNRAQAIEYFEKALEYDHDNEEYLSALCELRLSIKGKIDA
ncbi:interferon-induced protein with tetratricopeptide repeats 5-like [Hypanus sabinus]|uniref:interferon-induced protein with tetratricopeptide repeats 5-like n=1 Tax=Hypanus sabinus TaxID=79690 RepID=UPI0028C3FAF5|nr:interferon-induced protein with tetratricopeptide repeats 5-like [Hypanus sabinus]XP_059803492.1 interferon-induced protein with tetratricopeptide repeats 5-like [Hypanus sabinus]